MEIPRQPPGVPVMPRGWRAYNGACCGKQGNAATRQAPRLAHEKCGSALECRYSGVRKHSRRARTTRPLTCAFVTAMPAWREKPPFVWHRSPALAYRATNATKIHKNKELLMRTAARLLAILILAAAGSALAQGKHLIDPTPPGSLNPEPLPPLQNPDAPSTPAKELFARKSTPFPGPSRSIGGYFDGCLAGAVALPISG